MRGYLSSVDWIAKKGTQLSFQVDFDDMDVINSWLKKELDIEIKEHKERRSNDANSYMWVLADKIAEKIGKSTKEDVYRQAIRDVGVFTTVPIKENAITRYMEAWSKNGVGWVAEDIGRSKIEGYHNIRCYYGSSTYNTKEMARLVDWIVDEAKEMHIETLPPQELESMKASWGNL